MVAGIDQQLQAIAAGGVRIGWAVESGSRAWGFPSPDSDYDCRFLYVRPMAEYLTPWPRRDVIELPIDPVFDVSGWDVVKAVPLLEKGNATVVEWLQSPIVYRGDERFQADFLGLAAEIADPARLVAHHLHVGRLQWPDDPDAARLKRVLYALRSATTLRWLRTIGGRVPPMDLPTLVTQSDVDASTRSVIDELVARKAVTREAGTAPIPEPVLRFVTTEFAAAEARLEREPPPGDRSGARSAAEAFFRRAVGGELLSA